MYRFVHWNSNIVEDIKEDQDNGKILYASLSEDKGVRMAILLN